jgi:hypothetical protein
MRTPSVSLLLVGAVAWSGCKSSGSDSAGGGGDPFGPGPMARTSYEMELGRRFEAVTGALDGYHQRSADLLRIASGNLMRVLPGSPPTAADVKAFDEALVGLVPEYLKVLRSARDVAAYRGTTTPTSQPLRQEDGVEVIQQPLFWFAAAIVVPLAVSGWAHMRNIYNARTQPVVMRIMTATDDELAIMRQVMNLPADANRAQTLKHFQDDLGFSAQVDAAKQIESMFTLNPDNRPNVRPFGQEVNTAVANAGVEAGKAAVDLVVSSSTNVTGGSGIKELGQAAGLGTKAAEVVDLTVTAVQTGTGTPLAPLDMLSSHMQTAVSGGDPLQVPLPAAGMTTTQQAVDTATQADPPAGKLGAATTVLTQEIAKQTGTMMNGTDTADGGKMVTVPGRMHVITTENAQNTTKLQALNVGRATVVITARGHRTQTSEVTLAPSTTVKYLVDSTTSTDPNARCAAGDYGEAFRLFQSQGLSEGDTYINVATCAFVYYDYAGSLRLALKGASVSSKGGRAHNYFIAQLAAERLGQDGEGYGELGLEAAKGSGQCSGSSNEELCAELYRASVQGSLEKAQQNPR